MIELGILAINLIDNKKKLVAKVVNGWTVPKRFDIKNHILEYEIHRYSLDTNTNRTVDSVEILSVKINL